MTKLDEDLLAFLEWLEPFISSPFHDGKTAPVSTGVMTWATELHRRLMAELTDRRELGGQVSEVVRALVKHSNNPSWAMVHPGRAKTASPKYMRAIMVPSEILFLAGELLAAARMDTGTAAEEPAGTPPTTCADAAAEHAFEVGDVVQLKSGGATMTVSAADCCTVECVFMDRWGELKTEDLPLRCLRLADETDDALPF